MDGASPASFRSPSSRRFAREAVRKHTGLGRVDLSKAYSSVTSPVSFLFPMAASDALAIKLQTLVV